MYARIYPHIPTYTHIKAYKPPHIQRNLVDTLLLFLLHSFAFIPSHSFVAFHSFILLHSVLHFRWIPSFASNLFTNPKTNPKTPQKPLVYYQLLNRTSIKSFSPSVGDLLLPHLLICSPHPMQSIVTSIVTPIATPQITTNPQQQLHLISQM